jgi:hypothetical protein
LADLGHHDSPSTLAQPFLRSQSPVCRVGTIPYIASDTLMKIIIEPASNPCKHIRHPLFLVCKNGERCRCDRKVIVVQFVSCIINPKRSE